jgi:hypothetical protein
MPIFRSPRKCRAREKAMALMVIHHKVRDYGEWRPAYDAHESNRVGAGITNGRVYRKAEDPNDLVVLLDVADVPRRAPGHRAKT